MIASSEFRNLACGLPPVPPKGNANFAWVQHLNRTESRTLATLHDTLLPKLLSGELSVAKLDSAERTGAQ